MSAKSFVWGAMCLLLPLHGMAQATGYDSFMQLVAQKNVAYMAEKYNIDIAQANLQAAKVFNDPELSVEYGNNQDWDLQMGQSVDVGLSYNVSLGGLRKARIRVAGSEKALTEASVDAYLCNLWAEASEAWADAWSSREKLKVVRQQKDYMEQIALSDSLRFQLGEIGRTDAMQSRLEAQSMQHQLFIMEAECQNAAMTLQQLAGGDVVTFPESEALPNWTQQYDEISIYAMAENNRADLRAAELSKTLSINNMKLVKASRAMELGLNLGYSYNKEVRNEIAPAPQFHGLSVGFSIPLKFSNGNKGELRAASTAVQQSASLLEAARQQVHTEVAQAYNLYMANKKVMRQYDGQMLENAKTILESRKVGYQQGESGLLELITAQQVYADLWCAYIDACHDSFVSEVKLRQAMGFFAQ